MDSLRTSINYHRKYLLYSRHKKDPRDWENSSVDKSTCHASVRTCLNFQDPANRWACSIAQTSVTSLVLWVDERQTRISSEACRAESRHTQQKGTVKRSCLK